MPSALSHAVAQWERFRMLFHRSLFLGVLLGGLMLTGFGCKKIDTTRPNMTAGRGSGQVTLPTISVNTKTEEQPTVPKERKPERQPDAETLRLRDIMASFQKSQSFRANITIGGTEGIQGQISYNQPNGMFGKLMLKNGFTTEMAVKNERVAVRTGTSTWSEVTGSAEGEQIATLFKAITNRGGLVPIYPSDNARHESVKDDAARRCKMHKLSQFMGNLGGFQPLHICVANGLPLYFSIPSEDGLIEIEYTDIDKPVDVFFPIP